MFQRPVQNDKAVKILYAFTTGNSVRKTGPMTESEERNANEVKNVFTEAIRMKSF